MDGLRELGVDQDTLVIFTSDNGPLPTLRGERAGIFRGSKLSLHEGGFRMPMIARWPGHVPAGRVEEQAVVHAVDFFPTFCAIAGAALPEGAALDGEDAGAALWGKAWMRKGVLFWEYGRNEKFFNYPQPIDRSPNLAMRDGKWKLLVNANGTGAELYDLIADPGEKKNLAEQQPDVAKAMIERVLAWRRSWPQAPK
jgi:arylsulfatase A-like enzyme